MDFNIQDEAQFPKVQFDCYVESIVGLDKVEKVVPKDWAKKMYNFGIMTDLKLGTIKLTQFTPFLHELQKSQLLLLMWKIGIVIKNQH